MRLFNVTEAVCDGNVGFSIHLYKACDSSSSLQAQTSLAMQMLLCLRLKIPRVRIYTVVLCEHLPAALA